MAFTGTPNFSVISKSKLQITGLSLAAGASGTIVLSDFSPVTDQVQLPEGFQPSDFRNYQNVVIGKIHSVEVRIHRQSAGAGPVPGAAPLDLTTVKAGLPFNVLITNQDGTNSTGDLEIYLQFQ